MVVLNKFVVSCLTWIGGA